MPTMNELIISALSDIAPTYPYELDEDDGNERDLRRIVFNYDVVGVAFGDDLPMFDKYLIQVHYFCPYNDDTVDVRAKIKLSLILAGFTYPEETVATIGKTARDEQHFVFECESVRPCELEAE